MKKKRDSRRLADSRVICRATFFWFPYPFHNDVFSRKQKKEDPKKTTVVLLSNPIGSGIVSSYNNNNSSSSHCPRSRRMTAYSSVYCLPDGGHIVISPIPIESVALFPLDFESCLFYLSFYFLSSIFGCSIYSFFETF
jgi:hypothetical protein